MALEMKYFVLRPKGKDINDLHAAAARHAMLAYAEIIEDKDPELADSLREWSGRETEASCELLAKGRL